MAFPLIPVIAGAAQLGSAAVSAGAQGSMNRKTREWSEFQTYLANEQEQKNFWRNYDVNKSNWLEQNKYAREVWDLENDYNSPKNQMLRFKAAGLNPHLIYGQNNMGGSVSTSNLQSADRSNVHKPEWNPRAPTFDFGSGVMSFIDAEQKQAQTDNIQAQRDVLKQDVALRIAQTGATIAGEAKTKQEMDFASQMFQVSVDAVKASTRKTSIEADVALSRNEREIAKNASDMREAAERILNMRGQRLNMELDNELKTMDIQLKKLGIQPSDNMFFRVLGRILGSAMDGDFDKYVAPDSNGNYRVDFNKR